LTGGRWSNFSYVNQIENVDPKQIVVVDMWSHWEMVVNTGLTVNKNVWFFFANVQQMPREVIQLALSYIEKKKLSQIVNDCI